MKSVRTVDANTRHLRLPTPRLTLQSNPLPPRAFGGKGVEGLKKEIASSSRTEGVIWIDRDPRPGR